MHIGHWVFATPIQGIIEWKRIKFYIQNTRESNDKSLRKYEQSTGRTVSEQQRTLGPKEGEIILEVVWRGCPKQISIHTKFLTPWEPVIGDGIVVIRGNWIGTPGVAKEKRDGGQWIVTFTLEETDESRDYEFIEKDLAAIEPFGA
jgi:hypothetical protein